jgi:hypothetical protein
LKSVEVGFEESGLLGKSFETLKKLPVKTEKLRLDVPLEKLSKIEFLSVEPGGEKGKPDRIKVRLFDLAGKPKEGVIVHEKRLVWKGKHPFADADAILDPARIKSITFNAAAPG